MTDTRDIATSRDGTPLGWHRAGEGPPIVLVHGACGDKGNWIWCTPHLAPSLTVYAVDRRGRGRSGDAPEYSIEREHEDLVAVVEAIGRPVTLVGHSYGGVVALGAARLTELVERLVLYEPSIEAHAFTDCDDWAARIDAHVEGGDRAAAALEFFRLASSAEEVAELRASEPAWRQIERDVHTVPRELRALKPMAAARFDAVTQPALLLVGERSPGYLSDGIARLAEELPSSRTVTIEGQGHLAQAFAPERVCAELLEFALAEEPAV